MFGVLKAGLVMESDFTGCARNEVSLTVIESHADLIDNFPNSI